MSPAADGAALVSDSTLRFRERNEVEQDLAEAGLVVEEIRDAPDRPGLELVVLARRSVATAEPRKRGGRADHPDRPDGPGSAEADWSART